MLENIKLSFHGIWSHKMRSVLTMLGIIIGIAAIIAIVSTIKGNSEMIKSSLIGANTNVVTVTLYQGEWTYDMTWNGNPEGILPIEQETVEALEQLDGVEKVSLYNSRENSDSTVYYQNTSFTGGVYGIDQSYFGLYGYKLNCGRTFIDSDYENPRKVAILDATAADSIFPGKSPIGEVLEISGEPFTVVGVVSQNTTTAPNINSVQDYQLYMGNTNGKLFLTDKIWPMVFRFDEVQSAAVKAVNTDAMTTAGKKVEDALNEKMNLSAETDYIFKSQDLMEQAKKLQDMSNATNQQLIWIAGISLLVGGIGVMNIMLVSVTERTREIGIRKSLGARTGSILLQFLAEAAIITMLGGIIGIILGMLGGNAVCSVLDITPKTHISTIIGATLFSSAVGLFFGIYPARKAAKLSPIEALRHE